MISFFFFFGATSVLYRRLGARRSFSDIAAATRLPPRNADTAQAFFTVTRKAARDAPP